MQEKTNDRCLDNRYLDGRYLDDRCIDETSMTMRDSHKKAQGRSAQAEGRRSH
jgi:hypothetical protein